jgi:hypothetical protein
MARIMAGMDRYRKDPGVGTLYPCADGEWVRADDALALAERVRELEAQRPAGERHRLQVAEGRLPEQAATIAGLEAELTEAHRLGAEIEARCDRRIAALEEALAIAKRGEEHEAEQRDRANEKLAAAEAKNQRLREARDAFKAMSNARGHFVEAVAFNDAEMIQAATAEVEAASAILTGLGIKPREVTPPTSHGVPEE